MTTYGASSDLTTLMAGASFSDDAAWCLKGDRSLREALGFLFFTVGVHQELTGCFFGQIEKKSYTFDMLFLGLRFSLFHLFFGWETTWSMSFII